ncbi:4062_t:CDS:2 [Funneliformis mosseae]|uniref:4062_t:CDS:1 n=1 Tax=Funneliformis mosseae TaxID=27381 RepID=A0A9N9DNG2_FUNMO|nr:4062_t:CDS:2 [Funneliformis mosseae]
MATFYNKLTTDKGSFPLIVLTFSHYVMIEQHVGEIINDYENRPPSGASDYKNLSKNDLVPNWSCNFVYLLIGVAVYLMHCGIDYGSHDLFLPNT